MLPASWRIVLTLDLMIVLAIYRRSLEYSIYFTLLVPPLDHQRSSVFDIPLIPPHLRTSITSPTNRALPKRKRHIDFLFLVLYTDQSHGNVWHGRLLGGLTGYIPEPGSSGGRKHIWRTPLGRLARPEWQLNVKDINQRSKVNGIRRQISRHPSSIHSYVHIGFLRGTMLRERSRRVCRNDSMGCVAEAQWHSGLAVVRRYLLSRHRGLRTFCHVRFHVSRYDSIDPHFVTRILCSQSTSESQNTRFRRRIRNGSVAALQTQQRTDVDDDRILIFSLSPTSQIPIPVPDVNKSTTWLLKQRHEHKK